MHTLKLTRPRFGVLEKVFPKIVVVLFLGKLDSLKSSVRLKPQSNKSTDLLNVAYSFDDERQCLFIIPHPSEKKHHLWYKVTAPTYAVRLRVN